MNSRSIEFFSIFLCLPSLLCSKRITMDFHHPIHPFPFSATKKLREDLDSFGRIRHHLHRRLGDDLLTQVKRDSFSSCDVSRKFLFG